MSPPSTTNAESVVVTLIAGDGPLPQDAVALLPRELGVPLRETRELRQDAGAVSAMELYLDAPDPEPLRAAVAGFAEQWLIDACVQPVRDKQPRRRLIVFDMDSTLIECEVIDELAVRAGVGDEVAAVTARAMRGELDFQASFRQRMGKLRGLAEVELEHVAAALPIMPGAQRLFAALRREGHYTAILSGGFDYFARRVQQQLGIDEVHANRLQIVDGALTGEVEGEIVDGARKEALLRELAAREGFALEDTVAVGDGANDLPMLATAGIGVAFHAKPRVRAEARCAVNRADLDALLLVLGVPAGE